MFYETKQMHNNLQRYVDTCLCSVGVFRALKNRFLHLYIFGSYIKIIDD